MRKARVRKDRGRYHTIIRGVNKQDIFYDNADREYFLELMARFGKKFGIIYYTYVIMDNHVHLLFADNSNLLSKFMQIICSVYARYFNRKYDRIGHLFADRFASKIINDDSQLLTSCRYILQNPQKAGICRASKYKWSSYNAYRKGSSLVDTKLIMSMFTSLDKLYKYMDETNDDSCLEIELRPSERHEQMVIKIMNLLQSDTPLINPALPKNQIRQQMRILKNAGLSIRNISRITGIGTYLIQTS